MSFSKTYGPSNNAENVLHKNQSTPNLDTNFSNELFVNLKKNYEERIRNLENQLKATHDVIENDPIIQTMKMSHISEEFRRQRINEIVEDSLNTEKEAEIEKLNKINAYLKTELINFEQEHQKIGYAYQEEINKYQNAVNELKDALNNEVQKNRHLEEDNQNLLVGLDQLSKQKQNLLYESEDKLSSQTQMFQKELQKLKVENSELKGRADQSIDLIRRKDESIENLRKELEKLQHDYNQLESVSGKARGEHDILSKAVDNAEAAYQEGKNQILELREKLKQSTELSGELERRCETLSKEKEEIVEKYEQISIQVKQVIQNEQKVTGDMVERIKEQYQAKIEEQNAQMIEFSLVNEGVLRENAELKAALEESKLNLDKVIALMKNDMRVIKNEWEKRCQEVELTAEKNMADLRTKHQIQINQLQNEYQTILNKRLGEPYGSDLQLHKTKTFDLELRAEMENKINQIEKDYILKAKHENILNTEILDLKTRHAQEMKELESKISTEYAKKIRDIAEKNRFEYESTVESLKAHSRSLDQQLSALKVENNKLNENLNIITGKSEALKIELEETENNQKLLRSELEEANSIAAKNKELYEAELRNSQEQLAKNEELSQELLLAETKAEELSHRVDQLTEENDNLYDIKSSLENDLYEAKAALEATEEECNNLSLKIQQINEEYIDSTQKLSNDLEGQKELARRLEEVEQLISELQGQISESETQITSLLSTVNEKEEKITELNAVIIKLEDFTTEVSNRATNFETNLTCSQTDCKELTKQLERVRNRLRNSRAKGSEILDEGLRNLREDIAQLKETTIQEVETGKKTMRTVVVEIIKQFQDKVESFKVFAESEKGREAVSIREEYELRLQQREGQILEEKLQAKNLFEMFEKEKEELKEKAKGQKRDILKVLKEYEAAMKKLEEENNELKEMSEHKTQENVQLQAFVNNVIKKLKEESDNVITNAVEKLELGYKEEIANIMKVVEELKESHVVRLNKFEDMVAEIESVYSTYLTQMKNTYEGRIQDYEKELSTTLQEAQTKEKEAADLKKELRELQEKYNELKEDNIQAFETFEKKISLFREIVKKEETERSSRSAQSDDSEKLKQEIATVKRELRMKDYKIDELNRAKETLRQDTSRYKEALDLKERALESQQKEFARTGRNREKEIEELQMLLKKSIDSFNSTLDNNMKITNRLERDTQEIAKTVRASGRSDYKKRVEIYDYKK